MLLARYSYDLAGNLTKFTDALDHSATYQYENHLMFKETNRNGLSFCFEYDGIDEDAKCIRTWGDKGIYDHKLTYLERTTIVENSLGHRSTYIHDGQGLVSKVIDPKGGIHILPS